MKSVVDAMNRSANLLCGEVCELLPEGWEIKIFMRGGEADIGLFNPQGEEVEVDGDDLNTGEIIAKLINTARGSDGLEVAYDISELLPDLGGEGEV